MAMDDAATKVLFDASRSPGYNERRRKNRMGINLVLFGGIVGTPIIFAFVWFFLYYVSGYSSELEIIGALLLLSIIGNEIIMFKFVRPTLLKIHKYTVRVVEGGLEFEGSYYPREQIKKIVRRGPSLSITIEGRRFPLADGGMKIDDQDRFVAALKTIAPRMEVEEFRTFR